VIRLEPFAVHQVTGLEAEDETPREMQPCDIWAQDGTWSRTATNPLVKEPLRE